MPEGRLEIGPVRASAGPRGWRVEFSVDGETVWFASQDAELRATADAALAAFLLPAAGRGIPLHLADPVDTRMLVAVPAIGAIVEEWWGMRVVPPITPGIATEGLSDDGVPSVGIAQFFSGGIDSFYTLLTATPPVTALVLVLGFDVPLHDEVRAADLVRRVRAVGAAEGRRVVVVRTNLRQIPVFEELGWPKTHGGALAAVAHLLGETVGVVRIASSYPEPWAAGWGSHWRLDGHWSSARVRIEHHGGRATRIDKIRAIGGHPLVAEHLQVCWQLRTPTGNCGVCAKCVGTALMLELAGHAAGRRQIPPVADLTAAVAALDRASFATSYQQLLDEGRLPGDLVPLVRALLARTGYADEGGRVGPASPLGSGRPWGLT